MMWVYKITLDNSSCYDKIIETFPSCYFSYRSRKCSSDIVLGNNPSNYLNEWNNVDKSNIVYIMLRTNDNIWYRYNELIKELNCKSSLIRIYEHD